MISEMPPNNNRICFYVGRLCMYTYVWPCAWCIQCMAINIRDEIICERGAERWQEEERERAIKVETCMHPFLFLPSPPSHRCAVIIISNSSNSIYFVQHLAIVLFSMAYPIHNTWFYVSLFNVLLLPHFVFMVYRYKH